mmetsp:Transcript_18610/g.38336  ORF Transcript_18610/g.38336 Transcript_18610/m.38336 type:complete len:234 (+) Transcript_18610:210-911(+)
MDVITRFAFVSGISRQFLFFYNSSTSIVSNTTPLQSANLWPLHAGRCLVPKHVFELAAHDKVLLHSCQCSLWVVFVAGLDAIAFGVDHGNVIGHLLNEFVSGVHVDPGIVLGFAVALAGRILRIQFLAEFQHDVPHVHVHPKAGQQGRQALRVGFRRHNSLDVRGVQQTVGHSFHRIVRFTLFGCIDLPFLEEGIVEFHLAYLGALGKCVESGGVFGGRRLLRDASQTIGIIS